MVTQTKDLDDLASLKAKLKARTASREEKLRLREIRLALLSAQVAKQRAAIDDAKRKTETRRKIILGGLLLNRLAQGDDFADTVKRELAVHVSESDRAFLGGILPLAHREVVK